MLPSDSWSSQPVVEDFIAPRGETQADPLRAFDNGPLGIGNTIIGLLAARWVAWVDGNEVRLSKTNGNDEQVLFSEAGITKIDLTFNQNGQPFIAFSVGENIKTWGFDSLVGDYAVNAITTGAQPFCHLDDRRKSQSGSSDIILLYERDGSIYYRQQRDRFLDEYPTPHTNVGPVTIEAFGMGTNNRLTYRAVLLSL